MYDVGFLPWPSGLAAEINTVQSCLEVHHNGKHHKVFAMPYTVSEVTALMDEHDFAIREMTTFPTVSSIFPLDTLEYVESTWMQMEKAMATQGKGAYIMVAVEKTA